MNEVSTNRRSNRLLRRAAVAGVLGVAAGALALPSSPASAVGAGTYAYLVDEQGSSVSIVEAATGTDVADVVVGRSPHGVAVSPDGRQVYTATREGVSVIDPAQQAVTRTIALPDGTFPGDVALSPDGSRLYVTDIGVYQLDVIDTASGSLVSQVPLGGDSESVVATTGKVYVGDSDDKNVTVVDATTDQVSSTIPLTGAPEDLTLVPGAGLLYVTSDGNPGLSIIDTSTDTVVASNTDVTNGVQAALSPDGSKVYVTDLAGDLYAFDSATGTQLASRHDESLANMRPYVAVAPDGRIFLYYQFATTMDSALDVVDPTTLATTSSTPYDGAVARGLAISTVAPAPASKADVGVSLSGPASGSRNAAYTYTEIIKNAGPGAAADVAASVILPQGATLVSASAGYRRIGQLVVWRTVPSMGADATSTHTVRVRFSSKGTERVTAAAASLRTADPNLFNNLAVARTAIR